MPKRIKRRLRPENSLDKRPGIETQINARPPGIDRIADEMLYKGVAAFLPGIAIFVSNILASDKGEWGYFVLGLLLTVIGIFIIKTAQDFRCLKRWTWPVVSFLWDGRSVTGIRVFESLTDPEIRKAFGQDQGSD